MRLPLKSLLTFGLLFTLITAQAQYGWTNRFNGSSNTYDIASALAVDKSGHVFVTGEGNSPNSSGGGGEFTTIAYSNLSIPLWTNSYKGSGNKSAASSAITVDGSNNVFVTGYAVGNGSADDFVTIKYSNAGLPLWTNYYNGPGNAGDGGVSMAVGIGGSVYVTGNSIGSNGDNDIATIAYSNAGVPMWTNRFNGLGNSEDGAVAVAVDGAENVYVTGGSAAINGNYDYLTIAYSSNGYSLWTNRYGGLDNGMDVPSFLAIGRNGIVFVTGYSEGADNSFDYATIAYASAGVPLWTNRYHDGFAYSVATGTNDSVYVTGSASNDYATIAYSSTGEPLWTNRYHGVFGGTDVARAVAVGEYGNVYVTGSSSLANSGASDYATIAYTSEGVPLWTNRYSNVLGSSSTDQAQAISVDGSGNVYVTGYSYGNGTAADFATIKYSVVSVSLNIQRIGDQAILSWLNPVFSLQSAPALGGPFTNILGATTPHTNTIAGSQQYFRLRAD